MKHKPGLPSCDQKIKQRPGRSREPGKAERAETVESLGWKRLRAPPTPVTPLTTFLLGLKNMLSSLSGRNLRRGRGRVSRIHENIPVYFPSGFASRHKGRGWNCIQIWELEHQPRCSLLRWTRKVLPPRPKRVFVRVRL